MLITFSYAVVSLTHAYESQSTEGVFFVFVVGDAFRKNMCFLSGTEIICQSFVSICKYLSMCGYCIAPQPQLRPQQLL